VLGYFFGNGLFVLALFTLDVKSTRKSFEIIQNPQLVPGMEAYIKGNFEYFGIRFNDIKQLQKLGELLNTMELPHSSIEVQT
jgi:hypothetical protein